MGGLDPAAATHYEEKWRGLGRVTAHWYLRCPQGCGLPRKYRQFYTHTYLLGVNYTRSGWHETTNDGGQSYCPLSFLCLFKTWSTMKFSKLDIFCLSFLSPSFSLSLPIDLWVCEWFLYMGASVCVCTNVYSTYVIRWGFHFSRSSPENWSKLSLITIKLGKRDLAHTETSSRRVTKSTVLPQNPLAWRKPRRPNQWPAHPHSPSLSLTP